MVSPSESMADTQPQPRPALLRPLGMISLPNVDALFRFEIKFLSWFHDIGFIPGIDVTHSLGAFARRRVLVRYNLRAEGGATDFLAPGLGEREKEALVAGQ